MSVLASGSGAGPPSQVAARRKGADVEAGPRAADLRGNRSPRRGTRGEADVLVAECEPQSGMPGRGPDHGQAVGQGRPCPAPGLADRVTEFDHAARERYHLVELGERRGRISGGEFDPRGDPNALLHRRHQETAFGVMNRTLQRTCRVRLELAMV